MFNTRLLSKSGARLSSSCISATQRSRVTTRSFQSSAVNNDFFSWFKDKKKEKTKVKSTKEVISDIEAGKDVVEKKDNATTLELTPENFIGSFDKKRNDIPLDTVPFNRWISLDKVSTEAKLNSIILQSYNETFGTQLKEADNDKFTESFTDITKKFSFAKLLQAKSGFVLSDYQFTVLTSPNSFKDYYLREFVSGKSLRFKESEPNAIHLNKSSFKAPNIYIIPDVPAKEKRQKFKTLVNEVNEIENKITSDAIENAKQT
ncbi:similar to Saccharomyces cerevisiae YKR006C MRPL13 Mitochondrial ribosomal protein of the large subunit, not essential for mitochondrial translation [Maudiozyma saulgeensis]|uniref:Large ribosomal subunit protein mL50 n=1 Tax=Maudiozyma saulgeensis TaxID=1789683 RepID=A0A1X7QX05_9SACH|nr:similar to Saccharomyces cerevisiae YKR006C MRPL13 Mitochondrial ribosomal protein of the large subunit, not essential for mitochondrial translation [Kazachstania saulgeensis]